MFAAKSNSGKVKALILTPKPKTKSSLASKPASSSSIPIPDTSRLRAFDVARLWNLSSCAITKWQKAGCPRNDDGTYSLSSVIAWRESSIKKDVGINEADSASTPQMERKRRIEADRLQIKLNKELGLVIDAAAEQEKDVAKVRALKRGFGLLVRRLGPMLVRKADHIEVEETLSCEFDQLCEEFGRE